MRRGTTPTITFKINTELDLSDVAECWITLKDNLGAKEKTYTINDIFIDPEEKTIDIPMSQEDTLLFNTGAINIQIRLKMNDDMAYASEIKQIKMQGILKDGEI